MIDREIRNELEYLRWSRYSYVKIAARLWRYWKFLPKTAIYTARVIKGEAPSNRPTYNQTEAMMRRVSIDNMPLVTGRLATYLDENGIHDYGNERGFVVADNDEIRAAMRALSSLGWFYPGLIRRDPYQEELEETRERKEIIDELRTISAGKD